MAEFASSITPIATIQKLQRPLGSLPCSRLRGLKHELFDLGSGGRVHRRLHHEAVCPQRAFVGWRPAFPSGISFAVVVDAYMAALGLRLVAVEDPDKSGLAQIVHANPNISPVKDRCEPPLPTC